MQQAVFYRSIFFWGSRLVAGTGKDGKDGSGRQ